MAGLYFPCPVQKASAQKASSEDDPYEQEEGDADVAVATRSRPKVRRPRLFRVLLHNDDYTTMEFVIWVLKNIFAHTEEQAMQIMLAVHEKGSGTAGTFSFEIAESKVQRVESSAQDAQFPLRCTMEPA